MPLSICDLMVLLVASFVCGMLTAISLFYFLHVETHECKFVPKRMRRTL